MMHDLINWLVTTIGSMGYLGIFLLMAMESSVLPVPSELIMPPAGYLVQQGKMNMWLVITSGTLGSLAGAYANYFVAKLLGRPLLLKYGHYLLINEEKFTKVEKFFLQHGEVSTFVGRLLPVIRHLISLPAGLASMSHIKFSVYTLTGALIWVSALAWLGFWLGESEALLMQYSHQLVLACVVLSVVVVVAYGFWYKRRINQS